jgi:histidine ammonia-lyase
VPGLGVAEGYELIRQHVPPLAGDRVLSDDIERLRELVDSGALRGVVLKHAKSAAG